MFTFSPLSHHAFPSLPSINLLLYRWSMFQYLHFHPASTLIRVYFTLVTSIPHSRALFHFHPAFICLPASTCTFQSTVCLHFTFTPFQSLHSHLQSQITYRFSGFFCCGLACFLTLGFSSWQVFRLGCIASLVPVPYSALTLPKPLRPACLGLFTALTIALNRFGLL